MVWTEKIFRYFQNNMHQTIIIVADASTYYLTLHVLIVGSVI